MRKLNETTQTIGIEDIEQNIDYHEFYFFISRFMHEIKNVGEEKFVDFYETNLEQCKLDMCNIEYRILLSLLQTYDDTFTETTEFDKYIVGMDTHIRLFDDKRPVDFDKLISKSLKPFYQNGILIKKVDKVVGT